MYRLVCYKFTWWNIFIHSAITSLLTGYRRNSVAQVMWSYFTQISLNWKHNTDNDLLADLNMLEMEHGSAKPKIHMANRTSRALFKHTNVNSIIFNLSNSMFFLLSRVDEEHEIDKMRVRFREWQAAWNQNYFSIYFTDSNGFSVAAPK